jgi:nucleoside-diphosphate-sugar epimerase
MMLLYQDNEEEGEVRFAALFGLGLIGSSVLSNLKARGEWQARHVPFDWSWPEQKQKDAESIFEEVYRLLRLAVEAKGKRVRTAFVWSAGKGGFTASEDDMRAELDSFEVVLALAGRIVGALSGVDCVFHHLSSAGGLFEGQRLVDELSRPDPRRPYGRVKCKQEEYLAAADARIRKRVYRPTSVYGYAGPGRRMGLIPTLLMNGIRNKVSTIVGSFSTLRDYVLSDDVGRYISETLFADGSPDKRERFVLASGKPSSVFEVQQIVEKVIKKKILLEIRDDKENTSDITFSASALPKGWYASDMETGIRTIRERILMPISCGGHTVREDAAWRCL